MIPALRWRLSGGLWRPGVVGPGDHLRRLGLGDIEEVEAYDAVRDGVLRPSRCHGVEAVELGLCRVLRQVLDQRICPADLAGDLCLAEAIGAAEASVLLRPQAQGVEGVVYLCGAAGGLGPSVAGCGRSMAGRPP